MPETQSPSPTEPPRVPDGGAAFNVGAAHVGFAHAFVSTEETRYYLNGVLIEPRSEGGVNVVATDGHRLFVTHDPDGQCAAPIILQLPKPFLTQCRSAALRYARLTGAPATDFTITAVQAPGSVIAAAQAKVIDGKFPDWRHVVGGFEAKPGSPAFNSSYLGAFKDAARWSSDAGSMRVVACGDDGPALVLPAGDKWFALLMPMRHSNGKDIPSWAGVQAPKPVASKKKRAA